jgi:hypothetical protein
VRLITKQLKLKTMKRRFVAVLKMNPKEFQKVFNRCKDVSKGLKDNIATFPTPVPPTATLDTENGKLGTLITEADSGSHQKVADRDKQSEKVYGLLRTETTYVDYVADGDRAIVLLSGFQASAEPTPQPVPAKVVMKRVDSGKTEHSAKIFIIPLGKGIRYNVQVSTTNQEEDSFETVLSNKASTKLILADLTEGAKIYIRVNATNPAGDGDFSDPMEFIVR